VQKAWSRLAERDRLHTLEQVGLAQLARMQPGCCLAFTDEQSVYLLSQR